MEGTSFYHKIRPHHHVAIWAVAALAVILSASAYTNATIVKADNNGSGSQPNAAAKSFFGEGESGDRAKQIETPAACTQQQQQQNDTQRMQLFSQEGQLQQQLADLQNQLHNADQNGLTQDQKDALEHQISDLQDQLDKVKSQIDNLGGQQGEKGASEDCKKALVAQMKTHSDVFSSKIKDTILPRLDKVSATLKQLSDAITQLKAEGADPAKIATLQADVDQANADITTLKSFFNSMLTTMQGFQSHESSDDDAFDFMKNNRPDPSLQTKGASAANDLVSTFTSLQKDVAALTAATNGQ